MNDNNIKINIRVAKELKQAMEQHKKDHSIDWSSKIRKFIESEIKKNEVR